MMCLNEEPLDDENYLFTDCEFPEESGIEALNDTLYFILSEISIDAQPEI